MNNFFRNIAHRIYGKSYFFCIVCAKIKVSRLLVSILYVNKGIRAKAGILGKNNIFQEVNNEKIY